MRRQVRELIIIGALVAFGACTKDKPVAGPPPAVAAEKDPYVASISAKSESLASVKLEAKEGFHVNPDYPVNFKPSVANGAVKFSQDRIPLADGVKTPCAAKAEDSCAVEFDLSFTPEAGATSVQGVIAFSVCSAEKCLIEKVPLTLALK